MLEEFVQDKSIPEYERPALRQMPTKIDEVVATLLDRKCDKRGGLCELLSRRSDNIEPVNHVYLVSAEPKSIRAWVYHRLQWDRLAFTEGFFRIVLYDIREKSPTFGILEVIDAGVETPTLIKIPPYVVHGVQNRGTSLASFVNMPTEIFSHSNPYKWRLSPDHPGVPYKFV